MVASDGAGHRVLHNMNGVREITPGEVYAAVFSTIAEKVERVSNPVLGCCSWNSPVARKVMRVALAGSRLILTTE